MATDAAVEICEAVKDLLNTWQEADDFTPHKFTAARAYNLAPELQDDGVTHVDVAVREEDGEVASRGETEEEIAIDIVVRRKCDVDDLDVLDPLMGLLKQFKDKLVATRVTTDNYGDAWCHGWERSPAYFQNHIRDFRQFTGPLTLRFSIALDLP